MRKNLRKSLGYLSLFFNFIVILNLKTLKKTLKLFVRAISLKNTSKYIVLCCDNMATRERFVTIREESDIIDKVDRLAREQGIDRSGFYRMAVRDRIRMEADENAARYKRIK